MQNKTALIERTLNCIISASREERPIINRKQHRANTNTYTLSMCTLDRRTWAHKVGIRRPEMKCTVQTGLICVRFPGKRKIMHAPPPIIFPSGE